MAETALQAQEIVRRFPAGEKDVEILHGVSLTLAQGEIVAITGPSGAGKSTLLHILGLMDTPSGGRLEIAGHPTQALAASAKAELRNRTIGFLFQFHSLLEELTVLDNVTLPARISRRAAEETQTRAQTLLDTMGLGAHAAQRPATLSGGEQQRAALARALINDPKILLADEPTGNLDKETGRQVLNLIWETARRRQMSVVIVTHQEDIAARADRHLRMQDGRWESLI